MVSFEYIINDELGIHARPAGILNREVKRFSSRVTFVNAGKEADGEKVFAIMKLGIKQGEPLGVRVEGEDEAEAAEAIKAALAAAKL